jgi:hypothetical protein
MEARKRDFENWEFWKKKNEEERDKNRKKSELISSLQSILLELSNEQAKIQSCIDSNINEHKQKLEEKMRDFAIEFKENSDTQPPPLHFQIDKSFIEILSVSTPRLEELSKRMKFIDGLIQKVSPDLPDSSISEREQKIIDILSANSFFRSQDIESVQKMIDSGSNMRDCLELLRTYSNKFLFKMAHEISRQEMNQGDFTVEPKRLELEHQKLEQLLQELSKLNEEIEKRKIPFSTTSLVKCIFIESDKFPPSISEDTRMLEDRIKEMNQRFCDTKNLFVEFVQSQIDCRDALVRKVHSSYYDGSSDGENDSNYEEPTGNLRGNLKRSLDQIRSTRV